MSFGKILREKREPSENVTLCYVIVNYERETVGSSLSDLTGTGIGLENQNYLEYMLTKLFIKYNRENVILYCKH